MCGLAGFILQGSYGESDLDSLNHKMISKIVHRGPDDLGIWSDHALGIGLSHCRLSIQDLSSAGSQPMHSESSRYVIVFNGEIYNHLELREEITKKSFNAQNFKGHSDTETLLASIEIMGLQETLMKCVGMFAFALVDRQSQTLFLCRDRFGEKPLYYGFIGKNFIFGSELKALKPFPGFNSSISKEALSNFIQLSYIPTPQSIYKDIFKLEPGHVLSININQVSQSSISNIPYWSIEKSMAAASQNLYPNEKDGLEDLEKNLTNAVTSQLISDVSVGAFLSGGIDSSLIASIMQKNSMSKIKTFTIGFNESLYDESKFAKNVADYLGTDHYCLDVTPKDALNLIPDIPKIYDEPFADSSQIPTYFVSKAAKEFVTVSLSGDGADELFGGYNRYTWGPSIWQKASYLPYFSKEILANLARALTPQTLNIMLRYTNVVRPGEKIHKLSQALKGARSIDDMYINLISEWHEDEIVSSLDLIPLRERKQKFNIPTSFMINDSSLQMMYRDSKTYLPDDILCKVDRAAMALSLETRAPFLDHRVAESAWRLSIKSKIKGAEKKWALKQLLYKNIPQKLLDRPKTGFSIPIGAWLRGPLKDWAENLLHEKRLVLEGNFNPLPIRQAWKHHLSGKYDFSSKLWNVLMFQAWLEAQNQDKLLN